ncbi:MAG: UDP-N-acetylglucosamine 2-epimerase (non-hydrolyzing) [candidate division Zixibacteria bacterium]|nr:UDP-N-acetylglucosamine 2-epimerase (non-hydrolyzing) [candidate division Zixibacteria bacterium]
MKILIGLGTRPEAIKLTPLIFKLRSHFDVRIASTGQHDGLLMQVLKFFNVGLDYNLECMTESPNLEKLSINILSSMGSVLNDENPDIIIVQGDTLTVYQTAYLSFLRKIPIFHVEAGLRTHNKYSPFPEEFFRTAVGKLADFHFAPTLKAKTNLLADGIREDRILVTGNTVIDSQIIAERLIDENKIQNKLRNDGFPLAKLNGGRKNVLITVHRRENCGQHINNICSAIKYLASKCKDVNFIWLLHENPEIKGCIFNAFREVPPNVIFAPPVSYDSLLYFMKDCYLIMTDSGGIQEESPTFGKPVIVLRETTERTEIISNGNGLIVGNGIVKQNIIDLFLKIYNNGKYYKSFSEKSNPFGDGKAADRILQFMLMDEVKSFVKEYPDSANRILQFKGVEEYHNSH